MIGSHLPWVGSWLEAAEHYLYIIHFKVVTVHQLYCLPPPTVLSSSTHATPHSHISNFSHVPADDLSPSNSRVHWKKILAAVCDYSTFVEDKPILVSLYSLVNNVHNNTELKEFRLIRVSNICNIACRHERQLCM